MLQQGITACGIETSPLQPQHIRPVYRLQQGITACGIETRPVTCNIIDVRVELKLQQGITACGIETKNP